MGKGDKRTKRGKIFKKSFGKRRPKKKPKPAPDERKAPDRGIGRREPGWAKPRESRSPRLSRR